MNEVVLHPHSKDILPDTDRRVHLEKIYQPSRKTISNTSRKVFREDEPIKPYAVGLGVWFLGLDLNNLFTVDQRLR